MMQAALDYSAPAELFYNSSLRSNRKMVYRRFPTAAEAISFAIEELGVVAAGFTTLQVGEDRFERGQIRRLYDGPEYPLTRKAVD
jgi:hypothetical protein